MAGWPSDANRPERQAEDAGRSIPVLSQTSRETDFVHRGPEPQPVQTPTRALDGLYKFLYSTMAKELRWVGRALEDLREFPAEARRDAGHQLHLVQLGLELDDWRPMPAVGAGAVEIRIHDDAEYRVFYVAKYSEAVYVLHAFGKKSRKTAQRDINLGRERFKELQAWRRNAGL